MASILDIEHTFEKVTAKKLKGLGFEKTPWGATKKVVNVGEFKKGWKGRQAKLIFDKCQYCWMFYDEVTDDYWRGLIYYYPEGFEGYVTAFQGMENWTKKNPEHPANYVYITIDNRDDHWYEIIKVDCMADIELAITIMKNRIKKLNEEMFFEI